MSNRNLSTRLSNRQRIGFGAAATAAMLLAGGSLSYGVWSANDQGAHIDAATGSLDADLNLASAYWVRTTDGYTQTYVANDRGPYTAPCGGLTSAVTSVTVPGGATCASLPTNVVTVPGDSFEYRVPLTTTAHGQNLAANLMLTLADPELLLAVQNGQVSVSFYLATANSDGSVGGQAAPSGGQPVSVLPNPGGTTATPGELAVSLINSSGSDSWIVVVDVTVLTDYQWWGDFTGPMAGPVDPSTDLAGSWTTGDVQINLVQIRGGQNG